MTYNEISQGIKTTYGFIANLNDELCCTCRNYNHLTGYCRWLEQNTHFDFISDGYMRKRSGQYRRKRAKQNRGEI